MKAQVGILFLWIISPFLVFSQTPVGTHGALGVSNNRVVDQDNEPVTLAGPSLFWSNTGWGGEDYYTSEIVSWMKEDWKSTIIRAAMGVEESGGYLSDASNKEKVKTVVDAAITNGVYVIIDWHSHHAEQHTQEAVDFFTEMATRYGQYDNVIYEIYNEPLQVSWSNVVKPYAETVIAAIRAVDPDNLIVVGTPTWSQDVDIASQDPITGYTNIAYTLHFYAGTHGQTLRNKAVTAMNNGIALFVTEWGTVNANGDGGVDQTSSDIWADFMCDYQLSHCNWALNDKQEGASALQPNTSAAGGWTTADLTTSGQYVRDLIRNWCGDVTVTRQEPFEGTPYAIPGTIEAENYDLGGQNVAFGENSPTNQAGGDYRNDPVDIAGQNGAFSVGYTEAGEWLEYTVDIQDSTSYSIDIRFAAADEFGGTFQLFLDEERIVEETQSGTSGSWSTWADIPLKGVYLPAGEHVLRFSFAQGGFNLDKMTFTKELVVSQSNYSATISYAVYPNPNTGICSFSLPSKLQSADLIVFNAKGIVVKNTKISSSNPSLDIREQPNGIYFIQIRTTQNSELIKIEKR